MLLTLSSIKPSRDGGTLIIWRIVVAFLYHTKEKDKSTTKGWPSSYLLLESKATMYI